MLTLCLRLRLLAAILLIRLSRITNSGAVQVCPKSHPHKNHPDRHRGFSISGTPAKSHSRAKKIHAVDENPDDNARIKDEQEGIKDEQEDKTQHAIHNRRRSMSLGETDFVAHVGGKRFAKYSNQAAQQGLGANLARRAYTRRSKANDFEENEDAGASSNMNWQRRFADPLQKKEVVDQLHHILKNHKDGDTDKMHPNRPRRMSMLRRLSAGIVEWNERLGFNPAITSELEFLRDERGEQVIRKIAQNDVDLVLGESQKLAPKLEDQGDSQNKNKAYEVDRIRAKKDLFSKTCSGPASQQPLKQVYTQAAAPQHSRARERERESCRRNDEERERENRGRNDAKIPHKHPSRGKQTAYSLREERDALWARTASTE
jgi:hypothetical protein